MEVIKKHVDTVIILGGILGAVLWINGQLNDLKKDMAVVKAVLIIKGIMPVEIAAKGEIK